MALRSKSKLRLLILASGITVMSAGVVTVWYVRKQHRLQTTMAMYPAGMKAYQDGETVLALNDLGQYLRESDSSNVEALETYAKVRLSLPEKDDQHLKDAMARYRRLMTLKPGNEEYKHALLKLYGQLGMSTEVVQLATTMLDKDSKDLEARERKTSALMALRKLDPASMAGVELPAEEKVSGSTEGKLSAIESAQKELEVDPLSQPATQQILKIMVELGKTPVEIETWGLNQVKGREGAPEAAYVEAMAYGYAGKQKEAQAAMMRCQAAAPSSVKYAGYVVEMMDDVELFSEATAYLERNVPVLKDPKLTEDLYRRLAYAGQYERVEKDLSAPEAHAEKSTILTVLRAFALCEMKKQEEAKPLLDVLTTRGGRWDYAASDWRSVLEAIYYPTPKTRQRDVIDTCLEAAARDREEAIFQVFLGDTYTNGGDSNAAISHLQLAAKLAPSWAAPLMKMARLFEATNNPEAVYRLAVLARKRVPNDQDVLVTLAQAWNASLGKPGVDDAAQLQDLLKEIHTKFPKADGTLPLEVELAYRLAGNHELGLDAARKRTHEIALRTPAVSEATLLRLAVVSAENKLGDASVAECLTASEKAYGVTPQFASTQSALLLKSGDREGAKKFMQEAVAKGMAAHAEQKDAWGMAWCGLLELIRDPAVPLAWYEVGLKNPPKELLKEDAYARQELTENTKILWAMLDAPSVWRSREFAGAVLEQLKQLNGDTGLSWRVDKARWLLEDPRSQGAATTLLTETLRTSPTSPAVRELLAKAYENAGDSASAATQLVAAAELDPQNMQLRLAAARTLLRLNEKQRALNFLKGIKDALWTTDLQRLQAGVLLYQADATDEAKAILEATVKQEGKDVPLVSLDNTGAAALTLAALYWQKHDFAMADRTFQSLLKQPTAESIGEAAAFYLAQHNVKEAEDTIGLLDKMTIDPGRADLVRGRFKVQSDLAKEAIPLLRKAVAEAPELADAWRWLVTSLLTEKQIPETITAAQQAVEASKAAKEKLAKLRATTTTTPKQLADGIKVVDEMQAISAQGPIKACAVGSPDVKKMLEDDDGRNYMLTCLLTPEDAKGVESAPSAFSRADVVATRDALKLLAERNTDSLAMQVLAIRKLALVNPPEEALRIAQQAYARFPTSPQAAFYVSTLNTIMGHTDEAMGAAEKWRENSANDTSAVLALGKGYLQTQRAKEAESQLQELRKNLKPEDPKYREMMFLLVSAMVQQGRVKEAETLLWPAVQADPKLKDAWARIGADWIPGLDAAEAWLKKQSDLTAPDDFEGQMREGMALFRLGERIRAPLMLPADAAAAEKQKAGGKRLTDKGVAMMVQMLERKAAEKHADPKEQEMARQLYARGALYLGGTFEYLGDLKNAELYYRETLKADPRLHPAANNLAMVLAKEGDPARLTEAVKFAQLAVQAQADVSAYYDTLSFVLERNKQYDDAVRAINRAVDLEPLNPVWQVNLVDVLVTAGKTPEAKIAMDRLEKLHFDAASFPEDIKKRYDDARVALGRV